MGETQAEGTWDTGCQLCTQFLESQGVTQPMLVEHVKSLRQQMEKDQEKLKSGIKRVYASEGQDPSEKRCKQEDLEEVKEEKVEKENKQEKSEDEMDDTEAACMGKQDLLRTASWKSKQFCRSRVVVSELWLCHLTM